MRRFSTAILAAITILALAVIVAPAMAAPASSTGVHCDTTGNLTIAIQEAPAGSSLNVDGTCPGHFTIDKDLQLNGAATLDGGGTGTTLTITAGSVVTLNSITVTRGANSGIVNHGDLKLSRSVISGNNGTDGAGIYNDGAVLLNSSTVSGNTASGNGGGIYSTGNTPGRYNIGPLSLAKSTVTGNAAAAGGGIWANSYVKIASSDFAGNIGTYTAPYIGVLVPLASLDVSHSTFVA